MELITSLQNEKIKQLKKQRDTLLFLDSPKLIEEAIKSHQNIIAILVEQNQQYDFIAGYDDITIKTTKIIIDAFASVKSNKGIVAVVQLKQNEIKKPTSNFLVLDNLQDAGNVGTLIRSALGSDFKDVYLIDSVSLSNIKTVRSSMGAVFNVNCYECNAEQFVSNFAKWNLPLYIADMNGKSVFNTTFKSIQGIAIGNEGNGVSDVIRHLSTDKVCIPMNNKLESLNAAVSGSIIMYQIRYGEKK